MPESSLTNHPELKDKKVIVTGANGFIGSMVIWQLNQLGLNQIIAVDSIPLSSRNLLQNLSYEKFLLHNDLWNYLESYATNEISWVIHLGACSSTTETNWNFLLENNTLYTKKIFEFSPSKQFNIIYASSAATYGDGTLGFSDQLDSEHLKPLNLYGESKVQFDRWIAKNSNMANHWYGLKFFNVYGPMEYHKGSMASVVYKNFHLINSEGHVKLFKSHLLDYKDGEQKRDFVYVKDVTRWIAELMVKKPKNGIYNMGFGQARTWLDLTRATFESMNKPINIDWIEIPENIKNQYQYFTEADMTTWKKIGMSAPEWSLEKGIDDYIKNHLSSSHPFVSSQKS